MEKLLIVQVAALAHMPNVEGLDFHSIQSVFPALTCTVQASFRTATFPAFHGMIANGLYFRSLKRPFFWEQSASLVRGERIWEVIRQRGKKVAMLFWQQSLGEKADIILSPAPIHKHHGGMIQDFYSVPSDLYRKISREIGKPFNLKRYWGPLASRKIGEWIVKATSIVLEDPELSPDLCLTYLPTMDYDLQRHDPENSSAGEKAKQALNKQISRLVECAQKKKYKVLIYGDYHINSVNEAIFPNLILSKAGFFKSRRVKNMLYPDFYQSQAFAMVDHEIAHIYIASLDKLEAVKRTLQEIPGIAKVLDREDKMEIGLEHENSGELVIVSEPGKWMAYPWWEKNRETPDYATHVDIHNKPGFDPCELFFGWPPGSISRKTSRIKGSHGQIGSGKDIIWGADFQLFGNPKNLIELASLIKLRFEKG
jgi:predicted AlkP superfamily pyrophosphatase or phosphodiesterase